MGGSWRRTLLASVWMLLFATVAAGQLPIPQLKSVFPLGGQCGSSLQLVISGDDLDDARALRFSHPEITAEPKMEPAGPFDLKPRAVANTFVVNVAETVPPGLYEVRSVGYFGVSNPRMFVVDGLAETSPPALATTIGEAVPLAPGTAVSARAAAEGVHYFRLHVPGGRKVLVECFAERLDSRMDATLVLYDAAGKELRRARDSVGRDPLLLLAATDEEREYILGVYDYTYGGGDEYFYRLAVHSRPRLLYAFPPVVGEASEPHKLTLFGWNLPGGEAPPAEWSPDDLPLEQVTVWAALEGEAVVPPATEPQATFAAGVPYRLEGDNGPTNPVYIQQVPHTVVVERGNSESPHEAQAIPVPGEFVGRLESPGDRDWIEFAGNPGDVVHLDVLAHRMGAPADVVLAVHKVVVKPDGTTEMRQIASVDDRPYGRDRQLDISSTDPSERIVADEAAVYRVEVRDLYGNPTGDPRLVYRVSVRRDQPDFRVAAFVEPPRGPDNQPLPAGSLSLRRGGTAAMTVYAQRLGGFDGEVQVHAAGLPEGTTCRPARIRQGEDRTTLVISAAEDSPAWSGPVEIVGRAEVARGTARRRALAVTAVWPMPNPNTPPQVRLCRDTWLTVTDAPPSPATLDCGDGTSEPVVVHTCVGGRVEVPLRASRREGFEAEIGVTPVGLPDGVQFQADGITKDKPDVAARVFIGKSDLPPGTYGFHVRSRVRANLPRNPTAIAKAEVRQAHLAQLLEKKSAEAEQLTALAASTRAALETVEGERTTREAALATARQQAEEAAAKQEEESKRLSSTRESIATTASVDEATAALEGAQQQLVAAIEAARAARANVVQLEADAAASQASADVAATRLVVVERRLVAAAEAKTQLEQLAAAAAGQLEEIKKANAPRDYEFELISQPVRLVIEAAPVVIRSSAATVASPPGAAATLTIDIERRFGFDGEVILSLLSKDGSGITADEVRIAPEADAGEIEIRVGLEASPGLQACELVASMSFNGVAVRKRYPLKVIVQNVAENGGDE